MDKVVKESLTKNLNPQQLEAVETINGAVRLIAGAGAGKTNVLTKRYAKIVESGVAPNRILAITFTNKAAAEMKLRIGSLIDGISDTSLNVMTFHRFGLEVCKKDIERLGYKSDFKIGQTSVSILVSKYLEEHPCRLHGEALKEFQRLLCRACSLVLQDPEEYINMMTISGGIERCDEDIVIDYAHTVAEEAQRLNDAKDEANKEFKKNHPDGIAMSYYKAYFTGTLTQEIKDVYHNYLNLRKEFPQAKSREINPIESWVYEIMKMKQSLGTVSYDDLINFTLYLFKYYPEVKEYWQNQYDYIQVDEFQDTDAKQLQIVQCLSEKHGNIFVVGDPDQSIYFFRNARPELFNNLSAYIPNLKTLYLNKNYRSSDEIIAVSNSVIKLNKNRINKSLEGTNGSKGKVEVLTNEVLTDEEKAIVEEIVDMANANKLTAKKVIETLGAVASPKLSAKDNLIRAKQALSGEKSRARRPITVLEIEEQANILLNYDRSINMIVAEIKSLIKAGTKESEIAILYRSKKDPQLEHIYNALKKAGITLDSQFTPTSPIRELVETPIREYIKYDFTKDASFLGNVVDNLVDSDEDGNRYEMEAEYKDLLAPIDIHNYQEMYDLFLKIVPHQMNDAGNAPKGNYKKLMMNPTQCISIIEELVAEFDSLSIYEKIKMCSEEERLDNDVKLGDGVHIMTMHSVKGLEFPYVFVLGLEDGYFPKHGYGVSPATGIYTYEEEARIAYVAFSRARDKLYLVVPNQSVTSPFVAQVFMDENTRDYMECDNTAFLNLMDANATKIVDKFLDEMTFNSWSEIQKVLLKDNDDVVAYRYKTVMHGKRIAFDAIASEAEARGISPDGISEDNIIQITGYDGRHICTNEEANNLIYVRTLEDEDIRGTFLATPNIVELYEKYFTE